MTNTDEHYVVKLSDWAEIMNVSSYISDSGCNSEEDVDWISSLVWWEWVEEPFDLEFCFQNFMYML
jgi:hypothetical protein